MLISIIIPSYNSELYIEQTLQSIFEQTYKNYEVIVIDGGSKDKTNEIISKYIDKIAYYISEPDRGQSNAINKGLKYVKGEIWAWQNSDDIYFPNTFETVVKTFTEEHNLGMLYGDMAFIGPSGNTFFTKKAWKYNFTKMRRGRYIPGQPTTFFSSNVIKTIGEVNENLRYVMDYDFFVRIGKRYKIVKVNSVLGGFRFHKGSLTNNRDNYVKVRNELDATIAKYSNRSLTDILMILYYKIYHHLAYKLKYKSIFKKSE